MPLRQRKEVCNMLRYDDELNHQEIHFLIKGLFDTVRETNRRIDEVERVMQHPGCGSALTQHLAARKERLTDTRFCIMESIYEMRFRFRGLLAPETRASMEVVLDKEKLFGELEKL